MLIKLNRGPMSNALYVVRDGTTEHIVMKNRDHMKLMEMSMYHDAHVDIVKGTYAISNRRLKNGTIIFEWMGWIE